MQYYLDAKYTLAFNNCLVKTEVEILEIIKDDILMPEAEKPLCKLERFLRVLENSIVNSQRNAMYLVTHQRAVLLKKLSTYVIILQYWSSHYGS